MNDTRVRLARLRGSDWRNVSTEAALPWNAKLNHSRPGIIVARHDAVLSANGRCLCCEQLVFEEARYPEVRSRLVVVQITRPARDYREAATIANALALTAAGPAHPIRPISAAIPRAQPVGENLGWTEGNVETTLDVIMLPGSEWTANVYWRRTYAEPEGGKPGLSPHP